MNPSDFSPVLFHLLVLVEILALRLDIRLRPPRASISHPISSSLPVSHLPLLRRPLEPYLKVASALDTSVARTSAPIYMLPSVQNLKVDQLIF
jgi:hypothetical protein